MHEDETALVLDACELSALVNSLGDSEDLVGCVWVTTFLRLDPFLIRTVT